MYAKTCSRLSSAATVPSSLSSASTIKPLKPISTYPFPNFLRFNFVSNLTLKSSSRLKISHTTRKSSKHVCPVLISCLADDNSELYPELGQSSVQNESTQGATIDIKLPRRSLLVHFTCNACGERSQKLINRLAYEKGTVFVQCSGCFQYHKLVDNLSLVVEYDFREEGISMNSDTDQA